MTAPTIVGPRMTLALALWLSLSPLARTQLTEYAMSPTERIGCLLSEIRPDGEVAVREIHDLAATATAGHVVPHAGCPAGTVGMVHSHPRGERCWYWFPRTKVPTSDGEMFLRQSPYPIDAIVCKDRLVWIALPELRETPL